MYQFLALTSPGIEILLADELTDLGALHVVQKPEGVYFDADLALAYKISLWTRLATRILLKLGEGDAQDKDALYKSASEIPWSEHFSSQETFIIDFVGKSDEIRNSQFGGLTVKDAVVDHFRDQGEPRPSVDKLHTDISFQVRLLRQVATFYLDFSGRGLFQRGYRKDSGAAPLKENLAAAIIIRSGWLKDTNKPLLDPMCGSGTILIEAASMAAKHAPGIDRESWGFTYWPMHDQALFEQVLSEAKIIGQTAQAQLSLSLYGYDLDSRVIKTARQNAGLAGLAKFIDFQCRDANKLKNGFEIPGYMVFNPPYGERIGDLPELIETFDILGKTFKQQFLDWQIAIFTHNIEILSLLKLASFKRYKLKNGPLDCQLALYKIDEKQISKGSDDNSEFAKQDSAFANRLKKNVKGLKSWLKRENIECYRIYDGDIPEYNAALDIYQDHLVIQEYAAPANIPAETVAKRIQEVIYWAPKVLNIATNKVVLKTRQKQKGNNQYQKLTQTDQSMVVHEYGAKLKVNLWQYLDTGLFLDHRKTRQIVAKKAKGKTLLNLFAYTGSVSVQAALHGASAVTTVDMSKTYLAWAQDNFALNNLTGDQYQFVQADCLEWLKKNTQAYDVVFIDPPTFSNSKRMEDSFDVQRDYLEVLRDALPSLAPGGEIIFTNNKRKFKMDFEALERLGLTAKPMSEITRDQDFKRNIHIHNSWQITRS
ncbi:bifunctional 23S rRNA (guanine(2069)-N(7))-methyltransferase RlmK/23S rRNA (guanine(2445)-N(2))-methyltransferase RlmL [Thalassotalea agariperforans]